MKEEEERQEQLTLSQLRGMSQRRLKKCMTLMMEDGVKSTILSSLSTRKMRSEHDHSPLRKGVDLAKENLAGSALEKQLLSKGLTRNYSQKQVINDALMDDILKG